MNAVAKQEVITEPAPLAVVTPMTLIDRALTTGASPEIIGQFMALQERWDATQARKAFDAAIAAAKGEIKPIVRSRQGHNIKYVDFAAIAREVDPILKKHGLAYRFRTEQTERITVTCIVFGHGHSEESTLSGPPDKTGNKNDIQAIGSTLTYLQRYSLVQMLGLASADDDDGEAADGPKNITEQQVIDLRDTIHNLGAEETKVLSYVASRAKRPIATLEEIPANLFETVKTALNNWAKQQGAK